MKEILLGILIGFAISSIIISNKYTHNTVLITSDPFVIGDKTYICREQIISYKDINKEN